MLNTITPNRCSDLEDVGSLDEPHEGKETAVGPAVDRNTAQVHKVKLLCHVQQSLHLVFNLYLTLQRTDRVM